MKKISALIAATSLTAAMATPVFAASPDVYVVNFRNDKNVQSQALDSQLAPALSMISGNIEHVVIDTSTAARWEKSAHEAFDRDIVPVFNKWVGLPGFAAIVDARTKKVMGCVNGKYPSSEMAQEISQMASRAGGKAYMSSAAAGAKTTQCPPAFNQPPK